MSERPSSQSGRVDARDIERAVARGALKNRKLTEAFRTIERALDRDPSAAARVLRQWMTEPEKRR